MFFAIYGWKQYLRYSTLKCPCHHLTPISIKLFAVEMRMSVYQYVAVHCFWYLISSVSAS